MQGRTPQTMLYSRRAAYRVAHAWAEVLDRPMYTVHVAGTRRHAVVCAAVDDASGAVCKCYSETTGSISAPVADKAISNG